MVLLYTTFLLIRKENVYTYNKKKRGKNYGNDKKSN